MTTLKRSAACRLRWRALGTLPRTAREPPHRQISRPGWRPFPVVCHPIVDWGAARFAEPVRVRVGLIRPLLIVAALAFRANRILLKRGALGERTAGSQPTLQIMANWHPSRGAVDERLQLAAVAVRYCSQMLPLVGRRSSSRVIAALEATAATK